MERPFSIGDGDLFYRVTRRARLVRPTGTVRVLWFVAIAWLPLILGAVLHVLGARGPDPILFDLSVHARLLIELPLLLVAERMIGPLQRASIEQLYVGELADRNELDALLGRAERLRDSVWVEVVIAVLAVALGQLALWNVIGPTGMVSGIEHAGWSIARVWYAAISLPLVQFLVGRWLWRWGVWGYVLAKLARLPLSALATHPDRAAGLDFLGWPVLGFAAFVTAISSALAGAWSTQLLAGRTSVPSLVPTLVVFIAAMIAIACGPLVLFTGQVYRARLRALAQYSPLAFDYVQQFHAKWIDGTPAQPLLGTDDLQALNDLGGSFRVIATMRPTLISLEMLKNLFVAAMVPMLPLVLTVVPVQQLLRRLGPVLLGIAG